MDLDENETPARCIEKVVKALREDLNIEVTPGELDRVKIRLIQEEPPA